jgi:hypothetical protein
MQRPTTGRPGCKSRTARSGATSFALGSALSDSEWLYLSGLSSAADVPRSEDDAGAQMRYDMAEDEWQQKQPHNLQVERSRRRNQAVWHPRHGQTVRGSQQECKCSQGRHVATELTAVSPGCRSASGRRVRRTRRGGWRRGSRRSRAGWTRPRRRRRASRTSLAACKT